VPVLVLDVTEAEADKILLTLDPLAAMAEKNAAARCRIAQNDYDRERSGGRSARTHWRPSGLTGGRAAF